jgi:hypothetical protein
MVVIGTLAAGFMYIYINGRKFIDDASRYIWIL